MRDTTSLLAIGQILGIAMMVILIIKGWRSCTLMKRETVALKEQTEIMRKMNAESKAWRERMAR